MQRPHVISPQYQQAFDTQARDIGLRPDDPWVGAYVDYEWEHLRHIINALPRRLEGAHILECGCNVGASAIVLAAMGAQVTAYDIDESWVQLAALNARRYGEEAILFHAVADSRNLPFRDGQFDIVICNSVLEYVEYTQLRAVQAELDRVLKPGGLVLVTGSSNRLWMKETHSHQWLNNYLPRAFDVLAGRRLQRGMWPWHARYGFGPHYRNLDLPLTTGFFARARRAMGTDEKAINAVVTMAAILQTGPGLLAPNLSCLLRKNA